MNIWPDIQRPKTSDLEALARKVAEKHDIKLYGLKMRSRKGKYVEARKDFCIQAYKDYYQTTIAKFLNRHPSTISHLITNGA